MTLLTATKVRHCFGVLILSENTGAFEEVGAFAVPVNPFDSMPLQFALIRPRVACALPLAYTVRLMWMPPSNEARRLAR